MSPDSVPLTPVPTEDTRFVPAPTPRTVAMRTFLPWQAWRFIVINLRMLRMIAKSHD